MVFQMEILKTALEATFGHREFLTSKKFERGLKYKPLMESLAPLMKT